MNVNWLSHLPAPVRRALYFSLQAGIGSRVWQWWREFLSWERYTPEQLREAIDQRLSALLANATSQSEYYRALSMGVRAPETPVEWLRRFPILTRAKVREHFTRIVTDRLRGEITSPESVSSRRYDWLVVKTGGSTGMPTTVVHDARARDAGRATRLYAARQCGFPLGTPYIRLWGSEQDLLNQQVSLQQRLMRALLAEVPINAFRAREADLRRHHHTMLAHPEIQHLMTYVDAGAILAEFIRDRGLARPRFKTIMACAGTVTPEFRTVLRQVFDAEVFDKYGSRDCCDMACECRQHQGLHVFAPNVYLEVVDEAGQPCPPGQVGRLLVTLLNNLSFPMIRYEVGDLGTWAAPEACPCGSSFPRLQELHGRTDDVLVTEDGTWQTSAFVRHFVGVSLNRQIIREWQLEQTGATHFVFRYRSERQEGLADNLKRLEESFLLVFGNSATVEFQPVEEIASSPSGKVRWIVNSFRPRANTTAVQPQKERNISAV